MPANKIDELIAEKRAAYDEIGLRMSVGGGELPMNSQLLNQRCALQAKLLREIAELEALKRAGRGDATRGR